jgi:hypothetical protein
VVVLSFGREPLDDNLVLSASLPTIWLVGMGHLAFFALTADLALRALGALRGGPFFVFALAIGILRGWLGFDVLSSCFSRSARNMAGGSWMTTLAAGLSLGASPSREPLGNGRKVRALGHEAFDKLQPVRVDNGARDWTPLAAGTRSTQGLPLRRSLADIRWVPWAIAGLAAAP